MNKKNKGFTLIEVILALAVFSIVLISVLYAVTFSYTAQIRSRSQYNVNSYANSIINYIKVNKDLTNSYIIYFNTGDELLRGLEALGTGINGSTSGKFMAAINITNVNNTSFDGLTKIQVTVNDTSKSGKSCSKEFYEDR